MKHKVYEAIRAICLGYTTLGLIFSISLYSAPKSGAPFTLIFWFVSSLASLITAYYFQLLMKKSTPLGTTNQSSIVESLAFILGLIVLILFLLLFFSLWINGPLLYMIEAVLR